MNYTPFDNYTVDELTTLVMTSMDVTAREIALVNCIIDLQEEIRDLKG